MGQGKLNYPKVHWKQWRIEIVTVGDDVVAQRGVDWIYVVPFLYLIQHLFVCLCRSMARSPNLSFIVSEFDCDTELNKHLPSITISVI